MFDFVEEFKSESDFLRDEILVLLLECVFVVVETSEGAIIGELIEILGISFGTAIIEECSIGGVIYIGKRR